MACRRYIDLIRPHHKDLVSPPRESIRANSEVTDKTIKDRIFLLNHFEAYMEGKLHAGEKYCETDASLNTGMSYLAQYWRLNKLIAFRMSSGVLQVSRSGRRVDANAKLSEGCLSCSSTTTTIPNSSCRTTASRLPTLTTCTTSGLGISLASSRSRRAARKVQGKGDEWRAPGESLPMLGKLDRLHCHL